MNTKTRRELIEEAFDAEENQNDESPDSSQGAPEGNLEQEGAAPEGTAPDGGAPEGKEGQAESEEQKEAKASQEDGAPSEGKDEQKPVTKPDGTPLVDDKDGQQRAGAAPLSWDEKSKAAWTKLPQEVREQVAKREIEVQRALTYSAGARKFAEDFQKTVQPFAHLIQARGSTPLRAVHNLMNTAAGLTVGTPQQKADIVAEIIVNYGLDTELLDSTLAKALENKGKNVQEQIPPHLMQALRPVFDAANKLKEREEQAQTEAQANAAEAVETMASDPKYPFFNELREEIAEILEVAMNRGRKITMVKAYEMAVNQSDKHRDAMAQRRAASSVQQAARTLAAARNRKSATTGAPSSASQSKAPPTTRREAIERAWEEASN